DKLVTGVQTCALPIWGRDLARERDCERDRRSPRRKEDARPRRLSASPNSTGGMVLPVRIELTTSPLPRVCSTTELRQRLRRWREIGRASCRERVSYEV